MPIFNGKKNSTFSNNEKSLLMLGKILSQEDLKKLDSDLSTNLNLGQAAQSIKATTTLLSGTVVA